jgi:hypothetical protein
MIWPRKIKINARQRLKEKKFMKSALTKKVLTFFITAAILVNPMQLLAQDSTSTGVLDESLQDLTLVVGAGFAGAVLGLSTLSFAETPKDHLKNIAIGGALGIVLGVGIVVFSQATKSQAVVTDTALPLNSNAVESFARLDFAKQKIAESYFLPTTVGYNFSF